MPVRRGEHALRTPLSVAVSDFENLFILEHEGLVDAAVAPRAGEFRLRHTMSPAHNRSIGVRPSRMCTRVPCTKQPNLPSTVRYSQFSAHSVLSAMDTTWVCVVGILTTVVRAANHEASSQFRRMRMAQEWLQIIYVNI
jgi:hypothetical protein